MKKNKNVLAKIGELENLIEDYYFHAVVFPDEKTCNGSWLQKDLTDKANAIFYHLLDEMDYDCENNQELSEYMLRATDREAAIYWKKWLIILLMDLKK